jgi:hypothetical protein
MKEQVVRAKNGALTPAMREWVGLGWYEMAAFSVIRAKCCAEPPPLELPAPISGCKPLESMLDKLGRAAVAGNAVEAAVQSYGSELQCALRNGGGKAYGIRRPFQRTQETEFRKTLQRVRPPSKPPATPNAPAPQKPAPKRKK